LGNYKKLIGQKIQDRRIEMGFSTQAAFAKALCIDQSRVSRWESGANVPDPESKSEIMRILKCDESLFDISINEPKQTKAQLIVEAYSRLAPLNDTQLRAVITFIDTLTGFTGPADLGATDNVRAIKKKI